MSVSDKDGAATDIASFFRMPDLYACNWATIYERGPERRRCYDRKRHHRIAAGARLCHLAGQARYGDHHRNTPRSRLDPQGTSGGCLDHHHPDFLHGAANAITFKRRISVTDLESAREKGQKANDTLVGVAGFEPATPASRTQCSTGLSHTPTRTRLIALGFAHRKKMN
jgi:hypothetical protein